MLTATRNLGHWLPLSRRSPRLELLDHGRVAGEELRLNLGDLARLNRLPGGRASSADAVARLLGGRRQATVLDVGVGDGDMPRAFAARGWRVIGVDVDPSVAAVARERTADLPAVRIMEASATALPFDDNAVDVAHCSLLMHHLDPPAAVRALAEMGRVARRGIVVNDLRRGIAPLLATGVAVAALGRCRTTRHDGLLSVRRAYTPAELDVLLDQAGLRVVRRAGARMPRVVTIARRRAGP